MSDNRFRLRRLSPHADFEIRIEPWKVFYRVEEELVIVELVGRPSRKPILEALPLALQ